MQQTKRRDFLKATVGAAVATGLGEIREQSVQILGEKLDNLRVTWKPARIKGHKAQM